MKIKIWTSFFVLLFVGLSFANAQDSDFDQNLFYRFTNMWQGESRSMDVNSNGQDMFLGETGKYTGQIWKIITAEDGYYRLYNQWQGKTKSLDVYQDGSKPAMGDKGNYSGQFWLIVPQGDGYYRLTNKYQGEGRSLDVNPNGEEMMMGETGNYSGQFWKITPTECIPQNWYRDADGDSYGDPKQARKSCFQPDGYVYNNSDCDDSNKSVNPGTKEIAGNRLDDDCDGKIDKGISQGNPVKPQVEKPGKPIIVRPERPAKEGGNPKDLIAINVAKGNTFFVHPSNNSEEIQWGNADLDINGLKNFPYQADASQDFNGEENTKAIVSQLGDAKSANYAAKLCDDLEAYGFSDWYLPSAGELAEMYKVLGPKSIGGNGQMTEGIYWSSTEAGLHHGWRLISQKGIEGYSTKSKIGRCRCIRK